jgi:hypothetical protein
MNEQTFGETLDSCSAPCRTTEVILGKLWAQCAPSITSSAAAASSRLRAVRSTDSSA